MPNQYFQFKQFKVEQHKSAMKVCTDSCLFGAWISVDEHVKNILDIGSGTGLLSLMLAQKSAAKIDAIEIDELAFNQTKENFNNSEWKDRLTVFSGDVRSFELSAPYDLIICNPPFYQDEFSSSLIEEKIAKHSLHLSLRELLSAIDKLLTIKGKFAILLPYYRKTEFENLAANFHFYPLKTIAISQTTSHDFFRYAGIFSRQENIEIMQDSIAIKNELQNYTEEATALLKPYYLYL